MSIPKSSQPRAHRHRSYVASITADVNGMTASLHDLQSSWTGSASANFQGVLDQWHATQRQVEASITQINEALDPLLGVNYADTEQANALHVRRLRSQGSKPRTPPQAGADRAVKVPAARHTACQARQKAANIY